MSVLSKVEHVFSVRSVGRLGQNEDVRVIITEHAVVFYCLHDFMVRESYIRTSVIRIDEFRHVFSLKTRVHCLSMHSDLRPLAKPPRICLARLPATVFLALGGDNTHRVLCVLVAFALGLLKVFEALCGLLSCSIV